MHSFLRKLPVVLFALHFFGIFSLSDCLKVYCLDGDGQITIEKPHLPTAQIQAPGGPQQPEMSSTLSSSTFCDRLLHLSMACVNVGKRLRENLLASITACATLFAGMLLSCPARPPLRSSLALTQPPPNSPLTIRLRTTILLV